MIRISRILPDSVAQQVGMVSGTELLAVNGRELSDFLDWEFLTADDALTIEARLPEGKRVVYDIERPEGEAMGVELEPPTIRRCANRCEFCFIEGLPKGLRRSLYVRDDDYRLSFAYGNFATLSNLKERDFERILEYRLSPLYVSVHATPWEARKILLNNPRVPNILAQLKRLAAGGIQFHCQMVIVPGLNDGIVLEQSLCDLWNMRDAVISVALVPVGLTQFSHLYTGAPMDQVNASAILEQVECWEGRARVERGTAWVYGSDEVYLLARRELPEAEHYDDFPQIENGVGAVAHLRGRIREGLASLPRLDGLRIGVVTGSSMGQAGGIMAGILEQLAASSGARFEMLVAENSLFGPATTTAGLLTAQDIRRVLGPRADLDMALIPAETINDDGLFLDGVAFPALSKELPVPVHASYDFYDVLCRGEAGIASGRVGAVLQA